MDRRVAAQAEGIPLMTLERALLDKKTGKERVMPKEVRENLVLLTVKYISFDEKEYEGSLVVHRDLEKDLAAIFKKLRELQFPIHKIALPNEFDWDDEQLMANNITSCFNYRLIAGTDRLSNHADGRALDINTVQNPFFSRDGKVYPPGAVYDPSQPGTIVRGGEVEKLFKQYGFEWGGDWTSLKDYQHFEKLKKSEQDL